MNSKSRWTLGEIAKITGGRMSPAIDPQKTATAFHIRAWSCRPGCIFIPFHYPPLLAGENNMVRRAIKRRGAIAALVDSTDGLDDTLPYIQVADVNAATALIAAKAREKFTGKMIGVTGTAGKSTVKVMLGHVLKSADTTWTTRSNQNLTPHIITNLQSIAPTTQYAVMEIGLLLSHSIRLSTQAARPHVGVITSIGTNHADMFEEPYTGILHAKTDLLRHMEAGGTAVLPAFSDRFDELLAEARASERVGHIITCGTRPHDDVRLEGMQHDGAKTRATISAGTQTVHCDIPYPGEHMVQNATLVAGTLVALGLPLELMQHIADAPPPHSAMKRYRVQYPDNKVIELIDDSFNTGGLAVQAMARSAAVRTDKRKLLMICDIRGDREKLLEDGDLLYIKGTAAMKFGDVIKHIRKKGKTDQHRARGCATGH